MCSSDLWIGAGVGGAWGGTVWLVCRCAFGAVATLSNALVGAMVGVSIDALDRREGLIYDRLATRTSARVRVLPLVTEQQRALRVSFRF